MRYEAGNVSSLLTASANAPLVAFRVSAVERMALRELGVTLNSAVATRLGLVRATTPSVTPASTIAGQNETPGAPASTSLLVSGWTTAPVLAASYLRRINLPASIGAGFIWTWPADGPLFVGLGSAIAEICLANLNAAAPAIFDYYAIWDD